MKKLIILFGFIVLLSNSSFSQILSYRAESYSFKFKINKSSWSDWSKPENSSVLIHLNLDNERYTIYTKEKKTFDIIEDLGLETDNVGDEFWTMLCVDQNGIYCKVTLARLNSQKRHQLYIEYEDALVFYNIFVVE